MLVLVLLTALPTWGENIPQDSLQWLIQQGDSCMQQFNTFEALNHYQRAYAIAKARSQRQAVEQLELPLDKLEKLPQEEQDKIIERLKSSAEKSAIVPCQIQMKLADCYYRRANYRETSDLLKNIPEDSLSHESFRQLAYSYQKQGDQDSYVYWTGQLVKRFPMDGEMVAGLIRGYTMQDQAWKGLEIAQKYYCVDSTNILVNRAYADAYFMDRQFDKAATHFEQLLAQGDSVFNTLYSLGMSYGRLNSLESAYDCLIKAFLISGMQHKGCAYRLGVVCVDTKRYEEGLGYLDLALELMRPDTTTMRAITLSQGEGYYLTKDYGKAVEVWKEHLKYNPGSIATYYNIAQTSELLMNNPLQAEAYYKRFVELARQEAKPTEKLQQMVKQAEASLKAMEFFKEKRREGEKDIIIIE